MSAGPEPVELESHPPVRQSYFWMLYVGQVIPAVLLASAVLVVTGEVVAPSRDVFADFRTKLPVTTAWLLGLADFLTNRFGWILVVLFVAAVPLPICWWCQRVATRAAAWLGVLTGVLVQVIMVLVFLVFEIVAWLVPLITLISSVPSGT